MKPGLWYRDTPTGNIESIQSTHLYTSCSGWWYSSCQSIVRLPDNIIGTLLLIAHVLLLLSAFIDCHFLFTTNDDDDSAAKYSTEHSTDDAKRKLSRYMRLERNSHVAILFDCDSKLELKILIYSRIAYTSQHSGHNVKKLKTTPDSGVTSHPINICLDNI